MNMLCSLEILRDMTEKLTDRDAQMKFEHQRLSRIVRQSPIGMSMVGIDGKWLDPNPAICEMLGYTYDELIKKTWMDVTHEDDIEQDGMLSQMVYKEKVKYYYMKKRYIHKDGHVFPVLLIVSPIMCEKDIFLCFMSQILDMTHMKLDLKEAGYEPTAK